MAQNNTIRECKVLVTKVLRSVGRLTGDVVDDLQVEIAATLPLATLDAAKEVEEKLERPEYLESMVNEIINHSKIFLIHFCFYFNIFSESLFGAYKRQHWDSR